MNEEQPTSVQGSVQGLVESARQGKMSLQKLILALSGLGLTAAGASAVAAAATGRLGTKPPQRNQLKLHDQHVTHQTRGDVERIMADYHEDAVVEDPLFDQPF